MKYLFLLYGEPIPPAWTPEARKLLEDWTAARQAMDDAGVLISCAPLYPPEASTTVRVRDGAALLTDGQAAEIKESSAANTGGVREPGRGPGVGGHDPHRHRRQGRSPAVHRVPTAAGGRLTTRGEAVAAGFAVARCSGLSDQTDELFRELWWAAVAAVTRMAGGTCRRPRTRCRRPAPRALVQWPAGGRAGQPAGLAHRRRATQGAGPHPPRVPAAGEGGLALADGEFPALAGGGLAAGQRLPLSSARRRRRTRCDRR